MREAVFFLLYAIVLLFGVLLSAAFSGISLDRKQNWVTLLCVFAVLGLLQAAVYLLADEVQVWQLYPLIAHLPLVVFLHLHYHKRISTVLAAVATAYLCCQPANWFALLVEALSQSHLAANLIQIAVLLTVGYVSLRHFAPHLSEVFQKRNRDIWLFGSIPMVYYLFDYITGIYTDLPTTHYQMVLQFVPFLLCIVFLFFCIVYHREFEQKMDAEHKEQIIRVTVEQQAKEIEAVKKSEREIRLLRHDMRLLMNCIAVSIENGESEKAQEMIRSYISHIDGTKVERFCENDTVNYVLSDFVAKCRENEIKFSCTVEIGLLKVDETLFATVLSNALDNALNAQKCMPAEKRSIRLMIKEDNNRLLLSVKNPTNKKPLFVDGLPTTSEKGHGYGTQSIRYMTERMGGNCQFLLQDDLFILRIIL